MDSLIEPRRPTAMPLPRHDACIMAEGAFGLPYYAQSPQLSQLSGGVPAPAGSWDPIPLEDAYCSSPFPGGAPAAAGAWGPDPPSPREDSRFSSVSSFPGAAAYPRDHGAPSPALESCPLPTSGLGPGAGEANRVPLACSESAADISSEHPDVSRGPGGDSGRRKALAALRGAQEAVELRILCERLQLLASQRELAAVRCERFTQMLDCFLEEQQWKRQDQRGCSLKEEQQWQRQDQRDGLAGGHEPAAHETGYAASPQEGPASGTPPIPRIRTEGSASWRHPMSPPARRHGRSRQWSRQHSVACGDMSALRPSPPPRQGWKSPEFSGLFRNTTFHIQHHEESMLDVPMGRRSLP